MTARRGGSVFFLTDYGGTDEFAGVMRAVVARLAPGAPLVDLTHDLPPFDVRAGALALERAAPFLGPGVVVGVVDPGVGSPRRGVAVASAGVDGPGYFVGPDNGLLVWALEALGGVAAAVALGPGSAGIPVTPGARTFDGRDLFAPVAARLWQGTGLSEVGAPIDIHSLVRLARPRLAVAPGGVEAEVQWIDRFGNVQLAARPDDCPLARPGSTLAVVIGADVHQAQCVTSFADLAEGVLGVVADANGQLALVLHKRSAATVLGVRVGDVVTIRSRPPSSGSRS